MTTTRKIHPFNLALFDLLKVSPLVNWGLEFKELEYARIIISTLQKQPETAVCKNLEVRGSSTPELEASSPHNEIKMDINVQDDGGNSALLLAIESNHRRIAHLLFDTKRCHLNLQNNGGNTALISAVQKNNIKIALKLIDSEDCNLDLHNGLGNTALIQAAWNNCLEIVQKLIESKRCNLDLQTSNSSTALLSATWMNHHKIAHELIASKRCNLDIPNKDNDTPLSIAVKRNHLEIAHELIESKRCNLNQQNNHGDTALNLAAARNRLEIAYELIRAGAAINLPNKEGKTPLDYAVQNRKLFIVYLLITHDAQINEPEALLLFLNTCDQRKPDVFFCLKTLCEQQQRIREMKVADTKLILSEKSYAQANSYLDKVKRLNATYSGLVKNTVDTCNPNGMQAGPLGIIATYDYPIEGDRIRLFSPKKMLSPDHVRRMIPDIRSKKGWGCSIM